MGVRTVTLTRREIETAISRAENVHSQWRARYPKSDDGWHAIVCEFAALPKVWRSVWRARGRSAYYQPLTRVTGYGLPGYVMEPWNSAPREDWPAAHSPSVVADGLRREVWDFWPLYVLAMHATGRLEERTKINTAYLEGCLAPLGIRIATEGN